MVTWLPVFRPGLSSTKFCCYIKATKTTINLDSIEVEDVISDIAVSLAKADIMLD